MGQQGLQFSDVMYLAPELTLVIAAIVLTIIDMFLPKRVGRDLLGWLTFGSLLLTMILVMMQLGLGFDFSSFSFVQSQQEPIQLLSLSYRIDAFAGLLKLLFLGGTALIVFMSLGSVKEDDIPHVGEYYYFFLPAVLGAMVMASSGDLITLFIGLELLSITSYIMVGMRKNHKFSNEAAFKYIVQGGIASAIILYGMSFLYGMSGSTNITEINASLIKNGASFPALIYVAFFLLIAGFGFKIAAAPFHTWAADVYQGASTPVTTFLAVVSKGAGVAILFRLIYGIFLGVKPSEELPITEDVFFTLSVLAAITMIVGNLLALKQSNAKRLLAYSGVANAGYLLVPIATQFGLVHYSNFNEFFYYLFAYTFMNIGAFAVLMILENSTGSDKVNGFAGFYYRAPWTAAAMALLILSLAGIPVTGGFFGKLFILMGAMETQKYWLAAIMIGTSVISFYYYFGIIRQMFMRSDIDSKVIKVTVPLGITVWLCVAVTVIIGFFPQLVLGYIQNVFRLSKDLFMG